MTRTWLIIVLSVSSLSALAAPPAAKAGNRAKKDLRPKPKIIVMPTVGAGHVHFVTTETVYLDRGKRDGIEVGKPVEVFRGTRLVGECMVTSVADSTSLCTGAGFRRGDRISPVRPPEEPRPMRPAVPSVEQLERARVEVEGAPRELVEDSGRGGGGRGGLGLSAAFSFGEYVDFGSSRPATGIGQLDVSVDDLRVGHDVTVSAAASLLVVTGRPMRDRYPGGGITLLLRRAQARWTPSGLPLVISVGRVVPRHTPGLGLLDGAQVAWRSPSGAVEAGAFGGLLPSSALLAFSTSWAVGGYGSARLTSGAGPEGNTLQVDARAGWSSRPVLGTRFEAGVSAHGWVGSTFDAHAMALLSAGNPSAPSVVDSVWLDAGLHPTSRFALRVAGRYRGNPVFETDLPGVAGAAASAFHGTVDGWFEVTPWLQVGARVGGAFDAVTTGWAGPEVSLPQLMGGRLSAALGYEEDFSVARGRSLWGQASFSPSSKWRFTARGSWAMQQTTVPLGSSDAGGTFIAEVRPTRALWVRASAMWRSSLQVTTPVLAGSTLQVFGQVGADL